MKNAQITSDVIMVRPAAFGFNTQTAENNTFQHKPGIGEEEIKNRALSEFDELVRKMKAEGITVTVFQDSAEPFKPDAIFPNNWVSFHADGRIVTYPMYSEVRRRERRNEILLQIAEDYAFSEKVDMEDYEDEGQFLEGTGSMVLDRENKIAYACLSPRTNKDILAKWCDIMEFTPFYFIARYDSAEIYHTNVMMAIGEGIATVCLEVVEEEKRNALYASLKSTGHDVVILTEAQIGSFAGNMLAVKNRKGEQLMIMSASAFKSLTTGQIEQIERHARILYSEVETIESVGGGSVRCMIAENFLPPI